MKRLEITISAGEGPQRADKAILRQVPTLKGWQLRKAFAARDIKKNGQRIPADTLVSAGDVLHLYMPDDARLPAALDTIHEDEDYVIINKRQGMPVQGEASVEAAYLAQTGRQAFACHRLDVQTGGLVLLAKNDAALHIAEEAFASHALTKVYHAMVAGIPVPAASVLTGYLRKDAAQAKVYISDTPKPGALSIETRYRTLAVHADTALLEITLVTGRTHQIRAHLAHIGHPIAGDDKYGDRAYNHAHHLRRQQLWAVRLTLWDGRTFEVKAPFGVEGSKMHD